MPMPSLKYLLGLLIGLCLLPAQASLAGVVAGGDLAAHIDYRQDFMQWSLAGPGWNPNIISELTWRDVVIQQVGLKGGVRFAHWLGVEGSYQHGQVRSGRGQDSDYGGDNRSREFSRSYNDTDGEGTLDYTLGARLYLPKLVRPLWQVVPRAGFVRHEQTWRMTNGRQAVSDAKNQPPELTGAPPPLGSFDGLNSTYAAEWTGVYAGVQAQYRLLDRVRLEAGLQNQWLDYYGYANWNLITSFEHPKSFEQTAMAVGYLLSLSASYELAPARFFLNLDYQKWWTGNGTTRFFLADGSRPTQPLNKVDWLSRSLGIGIEIAF